MPKQEYKIQSFHGGTNNKFDPRDIGDDQNAVSRLSVRNPGRLTTEGSALTLYSKTDINPKAINDITGNLGFKAGYGLFSFSHDYSMDTTPLEVDTEFVVINDGADIDIYDPNQSTEWQEAKFKIGSRTATVKPEYYNVDGALRVCDSNFGVTQADATGDAETAAAITKNDVSISIDDDGGNVEIAAGTLIQIDQEIMYVTTGGTTQTFIVIRGYANTKIVAHADNTKVYYVNVPKYFGHIKQDRLFECNTSNSINAWVEDVQTPQPPNNTRKSDTAAGTLASSAGVQSLRVFDVIEGSTTNYPSESEKVVLEFSEGSADVGIIKVNHLGAGTLELTTSGRGSSSTAGHQLKSGMMISIDNVQTTIAGLTVTDLSNLAGSYEVKSTPSATTFTIHDEGFSSSMDESAVVGDADTYTATIDGWTDIGGDAGTHPGFIKVSNDETNLPGLQSSAAVDSEFWIHITGQTGAPELNGIHKAYKVDTDDLRFETSSHASSGDSTGEIQQLLGVVRPEDSDAINEDLKRKWNFAMSFAYNGPGQEVQESLLTMGHSLIPLTQTDGMTSNLINIADGSEIMTNGSSPGDTGWTERDTDGGTDGFQTFGANVNPIVFDKSENQDSSAINTLGTAIVSGKRYKLSFHVGIANLNIAIGGGDLTGNTMDNEFVASTGYLANNTHTVEFQATAAATHLWFTVDSSASAGDGTLDTFTCVEAGYGSAATSIVVDDGTVLSIGESIYIGTEEIYISDISTHTLTVTRGYNGSTAAHFGNDSLIRKMTELSSTQTVDWTNFTGVPSCVIKTVYNHGVDEKTWNARINGFKIYMRDVTEGDSSKEWRLFSHVNFNKGTYTLFAADDSELILEQPDDWANDGKVATISTGTELTIKPIDTYLSENLFTEETIIDAQYKAVEVVGRRAYIGNIRQGGRTYPDRMLRTPVNKFDTFPETNYIDVAVGDGDSITALKSFGDRLLQFKKNKVYIINVAGESEVLEAEYNNAGIKFPSQITKTNDGIAWVNESGLWYFDGKQAQNLTLHIEADGYAIGSGTVNSPKIGFDKKSNRLIYSPLIGAGAGTPWYIYDLGLKAYQGHYIGYIFPTGVTNYYTNMINDSNGDLIIGYVDSSSNQELNFYQWDNTDTEHSSNTTGTNLYKSKDIDFGSPGVRKKIYKVYVTYKCTGHSGVKMKYAIDGSDSFSEFSSSKSTNYDTSASGFQNSSSAWEVAELKPLSSINNVKSIQLSFDISTLESGTCRATGGEDSTSIILASGASSSDLTNYNIYIGGKTARFNGRLITGYNTTNKDCTVSALTDRGYGNVNDATSTYIVGAVAADFEINDITIIYRMKRVK